MVTPSNLRLKTESFPRDKWKGKILADLKLLVAFLNFRFHGGSTVWRELLHHHQDLLANVEFFYQAKPLTIWKKGALEEVQNLQEEIICNIEGVLYPENSENVGGGLAFLLRRLNRTLNTTSWFAARSSDRRPTKRLAPWEGVLCLVDGVWKVTRSTSINSFDHRLHSIVAIALESGEFTRITRCKNCNQYFVAEHARQGFCPRKCTVLYFKRDQADRQRRSRLDRKKRLARSKQRKRISEDKVALRTFISSPEFRKRLPGGPSQRTQRHEQEIRKLDSSPSVGHYLAHCEPAIKRIIERAALFREYSNSKSA